jgi:hypothetical protein
MSAAKRAEEASGGERRRTVVDLLVYAIALVKRGNVRLGGYFACTAFELVTANRAWTAQGEPKVWIDKDVALFEDIRSQLNSALVDENDLLGKRLDRCRSHRNRIVHHFEIEKVRVEALVEDLCHILGEDRHRIESNLDYEDFRRLNITFEEPIPQPGSTPFGGIDDEAFSDLVTMRRVLYSLADELAPFLGTLPIPLVFDRFSEVNPTSAYVWAPAVRSLEGVRPKIDQPSLSVLATNTDVRVYLDFGGRAIAARLAYYGYLLSDAFPAFLASAPEEVEVFDIDWYFVLGNRRPAQALGAALRRGEVDLGADVADWTARTRGGRTLTWNRMLVGRVFDRAEVEGKGAAFQSDVEQVMQWIYPVFAEVVKRSETAQVVRV